MNICVEDVPEVCLCCGEAWKPKVVLEVHMNYRDGSSITVIYGCKTCGKRTQTTYQRESARPLRRGHGIKITAY